MNKRISIIVLFLFILPGLIQAQSTRNRVKEGNKLYSEENYDQALNKFQDALLSDPENEKIQFNVGNTRYQKNKYEEALQDYQKVIGTEDLNLEQNAYFNLGNTLYRMQKLPESILAYKQALKLNPDDMDAKYNLEYVRRKIKENADKQQQDQQQQQQQNQEQQDQQDKDQEEKDQKDEDQQENNQQQDQQQQQQQAEEENKLSKEDAERILNALKNDEKDIQKKRKMKTSGKRRVLKDW